MGVEPHAPGVVEAHSLALEERPLQPVGTLSPEFRRELAGGVHHPVPRNPVGAVAQRPPGGPGGQPQPLPGRGASELPVSRDPSLGNAARQFVHPIELGHAARIAVVKLPPVPHPWATDRAGALAIQRELAPRVRAETPPGFRPRRVAGVDAAFPFGGACAAAAVVWDVAERRVVETRTARRPVFIPYLPGLLSFREAPAALAALAELETPVDAILCDGQGIAHPRRFGLACHLGVLTGLPTAGAAKSLLVGEAAEPGPRRGDRTPLTHRGDLVGAALRTRDRVRPMFLSVGHLLDLETAVELALACGNGFRMPEPTRRADAALRRQPVECPA